MLAVARRIVIASLALVGISALSHAQVRARRPMDVRGAGAEESTKVTLALAVGAKRYEQTKVGRCTYTPTASIYNTLAAMWSVQSAVSSNSSLAMTVWRPVRGDTTAQLNFNVNEGSTRQRIATVKGGEILGSGTVQVTKRGPGGRFEISGKTAEGASISGHIDCEKFAAPMPVGGN